MWNSSAGVPAGTDGWDRSTVPGTAAVKLPAAGSTNGDGDAGPSAAQRGSPASDGPPALIRWTGTPAPAASTAEPDSGTTTGVFVPVWVTTSDAAWGPEALGVYQTTIRAARPARTTVGDSATVNMAASGPVTVTDVTSTSAVPPLFNITRRWAVAPTVAWPKSRAAGSGVSGLSPGGTATPVPLSGTVSASGPEWATLRVAARPPTAVGVNVTARVTDSPGSRTVVPPSSKSSVKSPRAGPVTVTDSTVRAPLVAELVTTTSREAEVPSAVGPKATSVGEASASPLEEAQAAAPTATAAATAAEPANRAMRDLSMRRLPGHRRCPPVTHRAPTSLVVAYPLQAVL